VERCLRLWEWEDAAEDAGEDGGEDEDMED